MCGHSALEYLVRYVGHGGRGRHEPDRHSARTGRQIGFRESDDLRAAVDHGSTGIARGDGRVCLDEVDKALGRSIGRWHITVKCGNNARSDGLLQPERTANDDGQLPNFGKRGRELGGRKVAPVSFHHSHIGCVVNTDDGGRRLGSVREADPDARERLLLLVLHHVGVRDNGAVAAVDHSAADAP
ncbi:hypothetical protein D9M72_467940 [compost metagenome]